MPEIVKTEVREVGAQNCFLKLIADLVRGRLDDLSIDAGNLVDNEIRKFDCPVAAVCFGLFDIP